MITTSEMRLVNVPLSSVAFRKELPALLGLSDVYVSQLISPSVTIHGDKHRVLKFPKPFFTSRSGIRVWWVRDLENWASDVRRYRRGAVSNKIGSTLLDRSEIADVLLGRSSPNAF
jgi:hypothetical protein